MRAGAILRPILACALVACGGEDPGTASGAHVPRATRLAAQRDELASTLGRMDAYGHLDDVLAAIEALPAGWNEKKYLRLEGSGAVITEALLYLKHWNLPRPGRELPRADDLKLRGHPIHTFRERAERLASAGVVYLLVPVPNRLQVYPEILVDLPPGPGFAGMAPGETRFLAALTAEGIELVHLLPHFAERRGDGDLMLEYDHHWSPTGAELAAELIAQRVRQLDGFAPGPAREGVDFEVRAEPFTWKGPFHPDLRPYAEPRTVPARRVVSADGTPAHEPDRSSTILLLGDSSATWYDDVGADVVSHLYRLLGTRIDVIAQHGKAADELWQVLDRRDDPLGGKRLVIQLFGGGFRVKQMGRRQND